MRRHWCGSGDDLGGADVGFAEFFWKLEGWFPAIVFLRPVRFLSIISPQCVDKEFEKVLSNRKVVRAKTPSSMLMSSRRAYLDSLHTLIPS